METAPKYSSTCISIVKIITTVLFIVLPFLGFFLGVNYQASVTESSQMPLPPLLKSSLTKKATPTITYDETSNWKTYINEKYGFTFKYPSTLLIEERDGIIGFRTSPNNPKNPTQDNFALESANGIDLKAMRKISEENAQYQSSSKIKSEFNYKIGLNNAINASEIQITRYLDSGTSYDENIIYFKNNSNSYLIRLDHISPSDKIVLDQILSTFEFFDTQSSSAELSCSTDSDCGINTCGKCKIMNKKYLKPKDQICEIYCGKKPVCYQGECIGIPIIK